MELKAEMTKQVKLKADMTNEIGVGRPRCGNGIFVILTVIAI